MQSDAPFKSIGIVGLGLIGGSFAKTFSSLGIKVFGYDRDTPTIIACASDGDVFEGLTDDAEVFLSFSPELIYICLPVKATLKFLDYLGERGYSGFVTDSGSVKAAIEDKALKKTLKFSGGHPIKGKESSGYAVSEDGFFKGALQILTHGNSDELLEKLRDLHGRIGMRVSVMDSATHDKIFAHISHLPHVAAFGLVETVFKSNNEALSYAGGGFRDFTRIAASDPTMWADIFCDNSKEIVESLEEFEKIVSEWKSLIKEKKYEELKSKIGNISKVRRSLL